MKTATLQVMNGVAVTLGVHIRAMNGTTEPRAHSLICDFEVPSDTGHQDAQLLELRHVRGDGLPLEKKGLKAVLVISDEVELCRLNEKDSMSDEDKKALDLMEIM